MAVRLTRICAGLYEYKIGNRTYTISRNDEGDSSWYGEWCITSGLPFDYSDPIPTLRDCRLALADMEANPEKYGIQVANS